ncbi:unnamed protein product [Mytilus coruscus]|uniref:Vitellogenin domain-containing protein n=1 Tax=Mytilus coruscus TaxID=42192 RepID=A0A6J8CTB8_MYTCO|nr:unnamed protein product [Mytilus coruscus]
MRSNVSQQILEYYVLERNNSIEEVRRCLIHSIATKQPIPVICVREEYQCRGSQEMSDSQYSYQTTYTCKYVLERNNSVEEVRRCLIHSIATKQPIPVICVREEQQCRGSQEMSDSQYSYQTTYTCKYVLERNASVEEVREMSDSLYSYQKQPIPVICVREEQQCRGSQEMSDSQYSNQTTYTCKYVLERNTGVEEVRRCLIHSIATKQPIPVICVREEQQCRGSQEMSDSQYSYQTTYTCKYVLERNNSVEEVRRCLIHSIATKQPIPVICVREEQQCRGSQEMSDSQYSYQTTYTCKYVLERNASVEEVRRCLIHCIATKQPIPVICVREEQQCRGSQEMSDSQYSNQTTYTCKYVLERNTGVEEVRRCLIHSIATKQPIPVICVREEQQCRGSQKMSDSQYSYQTTYTCKYVLERNNSVEEVRRCLIHSIATKQPIPYVLERNNSVEGSQEMSDSQYSYQTTYTCKYVLERNASVEEVRRCLIHCIATKTTYTCKYVLLGTTTAKPTCRGSQEMSDSQYSYQNNLYLEEYRCRGSQEMSDSQYSYQTTYTCKYVLERNTSVEEVRRCLIHSIATKQPIPVICVREEQQCRGSQEMSDSQYSYQTTYTCKYVLERNNSVEEVGRCLIHSIATKQPTPVICVREEQQCRGSQEMSDSQYSNQTTYTCKYVLERNTGLEEVRRCLIHSIATKQPIPVICVREEQQCRGSQKMSDSQYSYQTTYTCKYVLERNNSVEEVRRCLIHSIATKQPIPNLVQAVENLCLGKNHSFHAEFVEIVKPRERPSMGRKYHDRDNHVALKRSLMHVLGNAGHPRSLQRITSYMELNKANPELRRAATQALRQFTCNESAAHLLRSTLFDSEDVVRHSAYEIYVEHPESKQLTKEQEDAVLA